jgi:putative transposase
VTDPRRVITESSYLVTRRCEERRRFLNPCTKVNEMLLYSFAYASQQHGVDVHSLVGMGNHVHETLTDVRAELPEFCHWAHTMIARSLNGWMDRRGCFWDGTRSYHACLLGVKGEVDPLEYAEDILDKMVYCAVNPVRAGLVKHARDWPGVNSVRWHIGEPIQVERPKFFFAEDTHLPEELTFSFVKPPGFEDMDDASFDRLFRERVRDEELAIRREMKVAGRSFAGPETVLKMERQGVPRTTEQPSEIVPLVASKDEDRRWSMLELIAAFREAYEEARQEWLAGYDVEFPAGTYQIRRQTPARCRGPDPVCA